ncbi:hypothetical protein [Streptomyces sp. NPDC020965]|uniref:hypothetical protein n=1 Tax=Streptomyces sp. NPDC020965 TaxID=3365105 RepID=UPI0037BA7966
MTRLSVPLALAVGAAETQSRCHLARLMRFLTVSSRELRVLRSELRRLESDAEFAAAWRAELAEGWRRVEFDRALDNVLRAGPNGDRA